ncbi:MAG: ZIP family metal transporter [Frankiaceae bacterium]
MAVLLALTAFFSTLTGGVVALRNRAHLHLLLGFTAGVILGVVAFDLLPEVFELAGNSAGNPPAAMMAFAAGFLALHLVERSSALHHSHEREYGEHRHPHVGVVSALGLAAHSFMDGVAIGLAFQASHQIGIVVALAVIAHDFADGLNTVGIVLSHGNTTRRSVVLLALDAVAPLLGAASTLLFHVSSGVLSLYLGFFAGFLLYLATADILPEAHSRQPSRLTFLCTFGGVVAMGLVVSAL